VVELYCGGTTARFTCDDGEHECLYDNCKKVDANASRYKIDCRVVAERKKDEEGKTRSIGRVEAYDCRMKKCASTRC
jgi:hypothetical protein